MRNIPALRGEPVSGTGTNSDRDGTNNDRRKARTSTRLGRKLKSVLMGNAGQVRRRRPFQSGSSLTPALERSQTRQTPASMPPRSRRTSQAPILFFASNPFVVCGGSMIAVSWQDKKRRPLRFLRKTKAPRHLSDALPVSACQLAFRPRRCILASAEGGQLRGIGNEKSWPRFAALRGSIHGRAGYRPRVRNSIG